MGTEVASKHWYEQGWFWVLVVIVIIGLWYGWGWYHTRISSSTPQASTYDCPTNKPIKGNAQSGIYHIPGGASYSMTKPEKCFASEEEAQRSGYRESKR